MLYALCKQYLIDKLKEAGIKTRPYTTRKALEKCMESHVGAVIFERETNVRNGSKKKIYRPTGSAAQTAESPRPGYHFQRHYR